MKEQAKVRKKLTQTQFLVLGFFMIIAVGTVLLMLPIASKDGSITPFHDSVFTAVSATCVTGLVVVDTFTHWSLFGQLVILALIQVGGLGFITIGVLFSLILRRKIGLKARGLMQESVNTVKIGGIIRLTKKIAKGTFLFEGAAALILGIRFAFDYGPLKGLYFGIFHSISAFCNAGFDLMGGSGEYSSLSEYADDPLVNIVIMALIIIGGIGFAVWDDVSTNKFQFRKYRLTTKIVLSTTLFLIVSGSILFYIVEYKHSMNGMNQGERVLASIFSSVTARTAGFNTIDTASLTGASKFLTIILMFIGGSPGSTAGGIKTTTIFVLIVSLFSGITRDQTGGFFKRRFEDDAVRRASTVALLNLLLAFAALFILLILNVKIPFEDLAFEVFSAIGTVGMSTGITRAITLPSRFIIILLMFAGRIGSLSFALSFLHKRKVAPIYYPKEKISVG